MQHKTTGSSKDITFRVFALLRALLLFGLMVVASFGGGLRWNGHLSHGWRSLAALDARTATHGSGTRRRSWWNRFLAAGFGLDQNILNHRGLALLRALLLEFANFD